MARLLEPSKGRITVNGTDLGELPEAVTGRRISYVGQDGFVFAASLGDNLFYGLKHRPPDGADNDSGSDFADEAERSGNSTADIEADWIDYGSVGAAGPEELRGLRPQGAQARRARRGRLPPGPARHGGSQEPVRTRRGGPARTSGVARAHQGTLDRRAYRALRPHPVQHQRDRRREPTVRPPREGRVQRRAVGRERLRAVRPRQGRAHRRLAVHRLSGGGNDGRAVCRPAAGTTSSSSSSALSVPTICRTCRR